MPSTSSAALSLLARFVHLFVATAHERLCRMAQIKEWLDAASLGKYYQDFVDANITDEQVRAARRRKLPPCFFRNG